MIIRPAQASDRTFILDLVPRLVEFGPGADRDVSHMIARDREVIEAALDNTGESAVFVAEHPAGHPVGFIHLTTSTDYYSAGPTGHIADLVVASSAAGQGVGSALIAFAEEWARGRGFALLTLHVFSANRRARDLYAKRGFQEEWIRCIKRL